MEAILAVVILAAAVAAVVAGIRASRRHAEAQRQRLQLRGFVPCETEAGQLQKIVRDLWGDSELEVGNVWRRSNQNGPIYWYEVRRGDRQDSAPSASDEFLCPLRRLSGAPFVVYLQPAPMKLGFASRLIENLLAVTTCKHLERIALGDDSASQAVLAAFGPRGKTLIDLLGDELLEFLVQGAGHGIFGIRGNGEHCSLEPLGVYARRSGALRPWEDSCAFVERLAAWKDRSRHRVATLTGL